MPDLNETLIKAEIAVAEAVKRAHETVANLDAQVANLKAHATPNEIATAERDRIIARLEALTAQVNALDPTKPDTLPEVVPTTETPRADVTAEIDKKSQATA